MTTIKKDFGSGGANLVPNGGAKPTLAETLRDIADDFVTVGGVAVLIASAAPTNPAAAALPSPLTTSTDAGGTYGAPEQTLINELKADLNTAVILINQMRAVQVAQNLVINEMRTNINTAVAAGGAIKTIKG